MHKPTTDIEKRLVEWDSDKHDTADDVHSHFDSISDRLGDWIDVSDEGRRLCEMMFDDPVEEGSAFDSLIAGIAAAAYECALRDVGLRIGVSTLALRAALESTPANQAQKFLDECVKAHQKRTARRR